MIKSLKLIKKNNFLSKSIHDLLSYFKFKIEFFFEFEKQVVQKRTIPIAKR